MEKFVPDSTSRIKFLVSPKVEDSIPNFWSNWRRWTLAGSSRAGNGRMYTTTQHPSRWWLAALQPSIIKEGHVKREVTCCLGHFKDLRRRERARKKTSSEHPWKIHHPIEFGEHIGYHRPHQKSMSRWSTIDSRIFPSANRTVASRHQ